MSAAEKAADNAKKKAGTKAGKQHVPATKAGKVTKSYTKESKMKINKEELKEIILEEIQNALCEEKYNQNVIEEAEYKGKKVTLNDPIRTSGESKKFKVYVKNDKGNVVVVRFGDPNMEIKRDDPKRRKSFRARHDCANKKDKTKAGYWSCWQWRAGAKVDN